MYGCESWTIKKAECWRIDAFELLEKTLDSPLDCKEIQPLHPKGNQSWIFIGWTNTEAGTAILWPPDAKNWLIWKDPDAGKDWRQEGGAGDDRRCVGWMASLTLRTWVWESSRNWWWIGKPMVLHSVELERVRHDWETEFKSVCMFSISKSFNVSIKRYFISFMWFVNYPGHSTWYYTSSGVTMAPSFLPYTHILINYFNFYWPL